MVLRAGSRFKLKTRDGVTLTTVKSVTLNPYRLTDMRYLARIDKSDLIFTFHFLSSKRSMSINSPTIASLTLKSLITNVGNSCSETGSTIKY